jgi:enterochelin esterase-like enzyme
MGNGGPLMALSRCPKGGAALAVILPLAACLSLSACSFQLALPSQRPTSTPPPQSVDPQTVTPSASKTPTDTPIEASLPTVEARATATTLSTAPSPTATPGCVETAGTLTSDSYQGAEVGGQVPILVYLPPCYSTSSEPYPVMYLLHGLGVGLDEHHWLNLGIEQAAESQPDGSDAPPWVFVMPRVPEPLFSRTDGGPQSYEGEFVRGVLPYVESTYNVRKDASGRALGGISRGGVWSLEIGFTHPELIDIVIGLSPAMEFNNARAPYDPMKLATSQASLPGHIFLAYGDSDWAKPKTQQLAAMLEERGMNPTMAFLPGGHEASTWEGLLPSMLAFGRQALESEPGPP